MRFDNSVRAKVQIVLGGFEQLFVARQIQHYANALTGSINDGNHSGSIGILACAPLSGERRSW